MMFLVNKTLTTEYNFKRPTGFSNIASYIFGGVADGC